MPIDREESVRIARLARLHLHHSELESLSRDLIHVVRYMDRLEQVNTDDIEVRGREEAGLAKLREDTSRPSLDTVDALRNAPNARDGFFRVPRVK